MSIRSSFALPVVTFFIFASMVLTGCKINFGSKGDSNLNDRKSKVEEAKKKKIANQISSFNETQSSLIGANQRNATACDKLDILWNKIVETQQDESEMLPPNGNMKEILAFGNGSTERFLRIFRGWSQSEGGSDIRPYEENTTNFVRLTHRYGVFAEMKFDVIPDAVKQMGLTGQFFEGNNCILGRLSSAVPTSVADRFTPAVTLKFITEGFRLLACLHSEAQNQDSGQD